MSNTIVEITTFLIMVGTLFIAYMARILLPRVWVQINYLDERITKLESVGNRTCCWKSEPNRIEAQPRESLDSDYQAEQETETHEAPSGSEASRGSSSSHGL